MHPRFKFRCIVVDSASTSDACDASNVHDVTLLIHFCSRTMLVEGSVVLYLWVCVCECACVFGFVCVWWSGGEREREREKMREWENETTKREWHGGNGPVLSFVTFDVVKPHKLHKMLSNHVNHNVLVSHYVCWGRSFLHGVCVDVGVHAVCEWHGRTNCTALF